MPNGIVIYTYAVYLVFSVWARSKNVSCWWQWHRAQ